MSTLGPTTRRLPAKSVVGRLGAALSPTSSAGLPAASAGLPAASWKLPAVESTNRGSA
jgi:hypothetical protein